MNPEEQERQLAEHRRRSSIAGDSVISLARAIRPLYAVTERYPDQTASCVLLRMRDQFLVLTAAHAIFPNNGMGFCIGCGEGLHPVNGQVYSSKRSGEDHSSDAVDAAVIHLKTPVPGDIQDSSLVLEDLDLEPLSQERFFHVICGFRGKTSYVDATTAKARMERFTSFEWRDAAYVERGFHRSGHVLLGYDKQTEVNGGMRTAPLPRGMSGGGVFRITGIPGRPGNPLPEDVKPWPKLTAIFIEAHKAVSGKRPVLVGTRVRAHLRLISHYSEQIFGS